MMLSAYLTTLYELAQNDSRVISIIADSGTGYDTLFQRDLPNRFFDFGIAEQHMVGAASGMAGEGLIPFVFTAGAFLAYRAFEFIRLDACFQRNNIKIVGMGSGLSWSTLGPTHHTTEDISCLRCLPGLTIFSPASPSEVREAVDAAYKISGPVYLRIGMNGEPEIHPGKFSFFPGKNIRLREGRDIAIFSTGSIIAEVLKAADMLMEHGVSAAVYDVHTLKPFDANDILLCKSDGIKMLFSVEEHNVIGGLGDMIGSVVAENGLAIPLCKIGLRDVFASGYGTEAEVRRSNELDATGILGQAFKALKRMVDNGCNII